MKRIVQAAIAAAFAALIVLALFYGRARKEAENKVDLAPRPSAATPFREETTLRNVTKAPIAYTVLPSPTPGYTLNGGQKLIGQSAAGAGSFSGNVTAAGGSFLVPGGSNSVNLLTFDNDLAFSGSGTIIMDVNTASWDKIGVTGNLNPAGVTTIQIVNAGGLPNGDYPLIEVSGTLGGSAANFAVSGLVSAGTRQSLSMAYDKSVTPNVVKLVVGGSPAGDLTWAGDGTANVWDVSGALKPGNLRARFWQGNPR